MDLSTFAQLAASSDDLGDDADAIAVALFGIAGEAGSIVSEAKKALREGGPLPNLGDSVSEEVGDLMWYVALLARRLRLDLNEVLEANLQKTEALWSSDLPPLSTYDDHGLDEESLPRQFSIRFEEDQSGEAPRVRMVPLGELAKRVNREAERRRNKGLLGDPLDDNSSVEDGYRYHDIIHLAHASVLGWSPVLRALMGAKRKSVHDLDRTEDGARAIAVEEGLSAFVFNYLEPSGFTPDALNWDLYQHIRRSVRGLEVASQPVSAWRRAYGQAFPIFLQLRSAGGGTVHCDLDEREMRFDD
jgi:NTP pyrophosphatase (non-canonical NTP hydrolase)